jgi:hypothetical protein
LTIDYHQLLRNAWLRLVKRIQTDTLPEEPMNELHHNNYYYSRQHAFSGGALCRRSDK